MKTRGSKSGRVATVLLRALSLGGKTLVFILTVSTLVLKPSGSAHSLYKHSPVP